MNATCGGRAGKIYYYNRIYRKAVMSYNGHLVEEDFDDIKLLQRTPYMHHQSYRFYEEILKKDK